ncbi:Cytochrome bo(3) ubiquinol oxidase subunit 3 [Klebsiella pneumoniae]|nr:Cytochrome bo(3) ubiquinol oxidase subunit 3 [Klebsiella pneumoniae]
MEIYEFHHLIMEGFGPDRSGCPRSSRWSAPTVYVTSGLIWMAVLMFRFTSA